MRFSLCYQPALGAGLNFSPEYVGELDWEEAQWYLARLRQ